MPLLAMLVVFLYGRMVVWDNSHLVLFDERGGRVWRLQREMTKKVWIDL